MKHNYVDAYDLNCNVQQAHGQMSHVELSTMLKM